jgi:hypothetical protein
MRRHHSIRACGYLLGLMWSLLAPAGEAGLTGVIPTVAATIRQSGADVAIAFTSSATS